MPDDNSKKVAQQGEVNFLQYLVKYFKQAGLLFAVWGVGWFEFSPSWVLLGLFGYMLNEEYRRVKTKKFEFAKQAVVNEKAAILARTDELPSWVSLHSLSKADLLKTKWSPQSALGFQVTKTTALNWLSHSDTESKFIYGPQVRAGRSSRYTIVV